MSCIRCCPTSSIKFDPRVPPCSNQVPIKTLLRRRCDRSRRPTAMAIWSLESIFGGPAGTAQRAFTRPLQASDALLN